MPRRSRSSKLTQKELRNNFKIANFLKNAARSEPTKYRCLACDRTLSCSHMGRGDVARHLTTGIHQQAVRALEKQRRIDVVSPKSIIDELRGVNLIAQHNIPILFADDFAYYIRSCFDVNFKCGRTKATALVHALANDCRDDIVKLMLSGPYSLSTDGSNDNSVEKMLPLVVSVINKEGVATRFLDMCMGVSGSAEAMYKSMTAVLQKYSIPLTNCTGLCLDNTAANMGDHNSMKTRITKENPSVFVNGCVCHILHNAGSKGARALQETFDVEDFASDVYNHFTNSQPRKIEFREFCTFVHTEYKTILKHVCTRWLSLERVINRILELYKALQSYFISTAVVDAKTKRLTKLFQNPITELYLLFLQSFMPLLTTPNKSLQCGVPQIQNVYDICHNTTQSVIRRFCTETIELPCDLDELPRRKGAQLRLGMATSFRLRQLITGELITDGQVNKFYRITASYMETVATYLQRTLPLTNEFLKSVRWVSPRVFNAEDMLETASRFRKVFAYTDVQLDGLTDKYEQLQISEEYLKLKEVYVEGTSDGSHFWSSVADIVSAGSMPFRDVSRLALAVAVIPHSNAAAERVFSMINKNIGGARGRLHKDTTLNNLMIIKCAQLPIDFLPSAELTKKAKAATRLSLLPTS